MIVRFGLEASMHFRTPIGPSCNQKRRERTIDSPFVQLLAEAPVSFSRHSYEQAWAGRVQLYP